MLLIIFFSNILFVNHRHELGSITLTKNTLKNIPFFLLLQNLFRLEIDDTSNRLQLKYNSQLLSFCTCTIIKDRINVYITITPQLGCILPQIRLKRQIED